MTLSLPIAHETEFADIQHDLGAAVDEARDLGGEALAIEAIRQYMAARSWELLPGASNVVEVAFQ